MFYIAIVIRNILSVITVLQNNESTCLSEEIIRICRVKCFSHEVSFMRKMTSNTSYIFLGGVHLIVFQFNESCYKLPLLIFIFINILDIITLFVSALLADSFLYGFSVSTNISFI